MLAYWVGGHGGPWFLFFPLIWIAFVILAVFLFRRGRPGWHANPAEDILGERYARGEISADEYRQRLDVLRRKSS
jgi:putative membrane protein